MSCSDDPERPKLPDDIDSTFTDLQQKDDVFGYLEFMYENMDIDRYPKLLDNGFIFWFSVADYNDGKTPELWARTEELGSARNLFSNFSHGLYGSITKITLDIENEGLWIEVPKTEPPYAGETWYQKKAEYDLTVETTSRYKLHASKNALFTIRQSEVDGENIYRIVLWHDDIQ
jgi:hypothetical protein